MPRFNPERVARMISSITVAVRHLSGLGQLDESEFLNDIHKIASAKYNLIVAIEAAIDLANHIISQNGFRAPDDYSDTFNVLLENGIIDEDFIMQLKNMAKFRNRLVHIYWEVDDKQVFEIVQSELDDFVKFIRSISLFLKLDSYNPDN
jgi:uncharacterized protein YutE (UPF0331/DUF86 family)